MIYHKNPKRLEIKFFQVRGGKQCHKNISKYLTLFRKYELVFSYRNKAKANMRRGLRNEVNS